MKQITFYLNGHKLRAYIDDDRVVKIEQTITINHLNCDLRRALLDALSYRGYDAFIYNDSEISVSRRTRDDRT